MIGWLIGFVQGVFAYVSVAALGIGLGLLIGYVARKFGYASASLVCAVALVALYAADAVDSMADARAQAEIAKLEATLTKKDRKLREVEATNAQLKDFLEKGRADAAHNATIMAGLRADAESSEVPQDCVWPKEFLNEVNKLR